MKRGDVTNRLGKIPYMLPEQADAITALILEHRCRRILELGFLHGVSTCYLAAALDELGGGSLTTVDMESARELQPNVETLLADLGLRDLVTVHYEPTSYLWRLMHLLEADPSPRFDLCYIDGAHTWSTDGFAFFLVDRLLEPGGWIVFDDLDWTFDTSPGLRRSEMVAQMLPEERATPQIRKVYELLVRTHPSYEQFVVRNGWALARKKADAVDEPRPMARELVYETRYRGVGGAILTMAKWMARHW